MFYNDGKTAVLVAGGVYAAGVFGWGFETMLVYGIVLSVFAVFGGFLGAWLFLKWRERNSPAARFKRKAEGGERRGWLQDRDAAQRWAAIDRDSLHPVNREAYDEIMEKLRTQGLPSLTARERAFLDRFSPT